MGIFSIPIEVSCIGWVWFLYRGTLKTNTYVLNLSFGLYIYIYTKKLSSKALKSYRVRWQKLPTKCNLNQISRSVYNASNVQMNREYKTTESLF